MNSTYYWKCHFYCPYNSLIGIFLDRKHPNRSCMVMNNNSSAAILTHFHVKYVSLYMSICAIAVETNILIRST